MTDSVKTLTLELQPKGVGWDKDVLVLVPKVPVYIPECRDYLAHREIPTNPNDPRMADLAGMDYRAGETVRVDREKWFPRDRYRVGRETMTPKQRLAARRDL